MHGSDGFVFLADRVLSARSAQCLVSGAEELLVPLVPNVVCLHWLCEDHGFEKLAARLQRG